MVDEVFVTVGSIMGSRIYGCSSESGGEVRVTCRYVRLHLRSPAARR